MQRYEDLEIYQRALRLSEETWDVVKTWSYFHQDTLGKQMVRASDSISANIAEGYGRYTFKERIRFCHYARGSLYEYDTHLKHAVSRGLVGETKYSEMKNAVWSLSRLLNGFVRYLSGKTGKES